jgi:hypothetical protein
MRRGLAAGLASLLAGGAVLVTATPGALAESTTIAVSPTRIEFLGDEGLAATRRVRISITGGSAGTVLLSMRDAVADAGGTWQDAPYGTTAASLQPALTVAPTSFDYVPNGATQVFTADLTVDAARVTAPLVGSLITVLGPAGDPNATVVQQAGVAIKVVASPGAEALAALPDEDFSLELTRLEVGTGRPYTPLGLLLPDIPGVVGRGPLSLTATTWNRGAVLLDTRVTYTFTRVSPFAILPLDVFRPRPLVVLEQAPRYLLPGQGFADAASSRSGGAASAKDASTIDAAPFIGLLRVTAQATGTIAGRQVVSLVRTKTVLAFPWGESLVLLVAYGAVRRARSRVRRTARFDAIVGTRTRAPSDEPATRRPRSEPVPRRAPAAPSVRKESLGEWWRRRGLETDRRMREAEGPREDARR